MFHFHREIKSTLNRMKYITLLVFTLALKALNEPFIFSLSTPQGNYCERIRLE
jgi:hypothetical protein